MTKTLADMPPADDESPSGTVAELDPGADASASGGPITPLTVTPLERAAIASLVRAARARGDDLTGPDGLLGLFTKTTLEIALDEEMSEHLGYDKHAVQGRGSGNSRKGVRTKTVLTDNAGPIQIEVPRDRDGSFEPVIVRKR